MKYVRGAVEKEKRCKSSRGSCLGVYCIWEKSWEIAKIGLIRCGLEKKHETLRNWSGNLFFEMLIRCGGYFGVKIMGNVFKFC